MFTTVIILILAILVLTWLAYRIFSKPSHDREWLRFHEKLPHFEVGTDGKILAHNVRSARYRTESDYDVSYNDAEFNLNDLSKVWFVIEPYSFGQAHTFLSFEFNDGRYLAVSAEVRKTENKGFRAWMVALWNYEIFYVVADEQDVLYLRTNIRKDPVMLYSLNLSLEEAQNVLRSVIKGVNGLYEKPAFYRILTRNCTNIPLGHLRAGSSRIPRFDYSYIITSESDRVLWRAGLIANDAPIAIIRRRYNVTEKAQVLECDERFSRRVRV